ncbi:Aste57867_7265 [Aphanomyces stellatus]|uniref:Aste57867_7265 protein n=1 Tax=Aphanomyces stellatus TaxID=120398 RepID=A0A485KI32_9STRA|nr:hypothetical protein As57867_007240 [Aphanomyces stellatus]VFT84187.1 Aste57867_7265 [Aphanomyces stellatus]
MRPHIDVGPAAHAYVEAVMAAGDDCVVVFVSQRALDAFDDAVVTALADLPHQVLTPTSMMTGLSTIDEEESSSSSAMDMPPRDQNEDSGAADAFDNDDGGEFLLPESPPSTTTSFRSLMNAVQHPSILDATLHMYLEANNAAPPFYPRGDGGLSMENVWDSDDDTESNVDSETTIDSDATGASYASSSFDNEDDDEVKDDNDALDRAHCFTAYPGVAPPPPRAADFDIVFAWMQQQRGWTRQPTMWGSFSYSRVPDHPSVLQAADENMSLIGDDAVEAHWKATGDWQSALLATTTMPLPPPRHSRRKPRCTMPGCTHVAAANHLCRGHGGGKSCRVPDCLGAAMGGSGKCKKHGGGARCGVAGCKRGAQGGGKCKAHGGGKKCSVGGCDKAAQRRGLCAAHGGKIACAVPGCKRTDRGGGLCEVHRVEKLCRSQGCHRLAKVHGLCSAHSRQQRAVELAAIARDGIALPAPVAADDVFLL